jgi:hypothetical protein
MAPVAEWSKVLGLNTLPRVSQVRISSDPQKFSSNIYSSRVYQHHFEFSVFDWKAFSGSVDLRNRQTHPIEFSYTEQRKIIG